MNILFICDHNPYNNAFGSQQRTNLIFNILIKLGRVDLVCFTKEIFDPIPMDSENIKILFFGKLTHKKINYLPKYLAKIYNLLSFLNPYSVYPKHTQASELVDSYLKKYKYDIVFVRYMKIAFLCGLVKNTNVFVDVDDLPEDTFLSHAKFLVKSPLKSLEYKYYSLRAHFHTNKFIKTIRHAYFSNSNHCAWKNSSYLPNIPFNHVDEGIPNRLKKSKSVVLFVGLLYHKPNYLGLNHFIRRIWPDIKKEIPEAVFRIAGDGLTAQQKSWIGKLMKGLNY